MAGMAGTVARGRGRAMNHRGLGVGWGVAREWWGAAGSGLCGEGCRDASGGVGATCKGWGGGPALHKP